MRTLGIYLLFFISFIGQAWAEVNVNTASASELTALKGVGPATAEKIIAYRDANGPFASCSDLINVKGIGVKKMESIAPECTTGEADGKKTKKEIITDTSAKGIDINSASATELTTLKGVGKKTAANIIAYREANGPFKSCEDLVNVKGIGNKMLEGFRPNCSVVITK